MNINLQGEIIKYLKNNILFDFSNKLCLDFNYFVCNFNDINLKIVNLNNDNDDNVLAQYDPGSKTILFDQKKQRKQIILTVF